MVYELMRLCPEDLAQFKRNMQEAFQLGAVEGGFPMDDDMQILPEADIDRSLNTPGAIAYKAVDDGEMIGGAIVTLDAEKGEGYLDFLYVRHGIQSKGVGRFIWFEIERLHPEIAVWRTCTPYFERRNIHFYVNVCRFHITDYFNARHPDPHAPPEWEAAPEGEDDGMFGFEKVLR